MTIKSVIISSILVTFICDSEEISKGEIRKRKKAIHVHVCKPQVFLRELTVHPGCWIAVSLREETRFGTIFFSEWPRWLCTFANRRLFVFH